MTDLEMTKLCAEAMGIRVKEYKGILAIYDPIYNPKQHNSCYEPLDDDQQAMALLKKFRLQCGWYEHGLDDDSGEWCAAFYSSSVYAKAQAESPDSLNRSIVECVAKLQAAKVAA
jgi:hypothetical protein